MFRFKDQPGSTCEIENMLIARMVNTGCILVMKNLINLLKDTSKGSKPSPVFRMPTKCHFRFFLLENNCDLNAVCANTEGSYHCSCNEGYTGDGRNCTGKMMCVADSKYRGYKVKVISVTSLGRPIRRALFSGFRSMKRLGVFILLPGWDASPIAGLPPALRRYPFIHLGGEKHRERKVSCPRTQHNIPGQAPNPDVPGVQGWRSGESTRLPPMWPGLDPQTRRHMWVEFVGSLLCTERFSLKTPVSPLLKTLPCCLGIVWHSFKPQTTQMKKTFPFRKLYHGTLVVCQWGLP